MSDSGVLDLGPAMADYATQRLKLQQEIDEAKLDLDGARKRYKADVGQHQLSFFEACIARDTALRTQLNQLDAKRSTNQMHVDSPATNPAPQPGKVVDNGQTLFWQELGRVQETKVGGESFNWTIKLEINYLRCDKVLGQAIFVRKEYHNLWKGFLDGDDPHDGVTGTPGTGKSFFLLYALWCLAVQKSTVIFQDVNGKMTLFVGGGEAYSGDSSSFQDELRDEKNFYLIDGDQKEGSLPATETVNARSFLATSPNPTVYKRYQKHHKVCLQLMPLWTRKSVEKLVVATKLGIPAEFTGRFWEVLDGVPRHLLFVHKMFQRKRGMDGLEEAASEIEVLNGHVSRFQGLLTGQLKKALGDAVNDLENVLTKIGGWAFPDDAEPCPQQYAKATASLDAAITATSQMGCAECLKGDTAVASLEAIRSFKADEQVKKREGLLELWTTSVFDQVANCLNDVNIEAGLQASSTGTAIENHISHALFYMVPKDDQTDTLKRVGNHQYKLPSKAVEHLFATKATELGHEKLRTFLAQTSSMGGSFPTIRSILFEGFAMAQITRGGAFKTAKLEETGRGVEHQTTFKRSTNMIFRTLDQVNTLTHAETGSPIHWIPILSNFASVDSFQDIGKLFQMTVSKSGHPLKLKSMRSYSSHLRKVDNGRHKNAVKHRMKVYFVVDEETYEHSDSFRRRQRILTDKEEDAKQSINHDQFVLVMPTTTSLSSAAEP